MVSITEEFDRVKANGNSKRIGPYKKKDVNFNEFLFNVLMNGSLEISMIYVTEAFLQEPLRQVMVHRAYKKDNQDFHEKLDSIYYTRYLIENNVSTYTEFP